MGWEPTTSQKWLRWVLCLVVLTGLPGCRQAAPPDEARARLLQTADANLSLAEQAAKYYPPESQDLFQSMDGKRIDGQYQPLDLTEQEVIGRNAWMIWTGGNEAFWDWLARHGYGTIDLLKLIDSHNRGSQFATTGLITEPGMRSPTAEETEAAYGIRFARPVRADYGMDNDNGMYARLMDAYRERSTPTQSSDSEEQGAAREQYDAPDLSSTGSSEGPYGDFQPPDPTIYGYSSGIVGLRLFPNPEFTPAAAKRFNAERYYNDPAYASNPSTIRPFRVGMACSFCHVGPHPLNPPLDPELPKWENLSSTIGAQYLRVRGAFGGELEPDNYFYHVLDSQFPGTIDTSLIASDNINNANTMNAVFGLGWRVRRAIHNPPEQLSPESEIYPGLWDGKYPEQVLPVDILAAQEQFEGNPRGVPRVLIDGADALGSWVALARVYLNIGSYHQRWIQVHNTIFGFRPQQPFKLLECEENSVYWHATKLRIDPMTAFFLKSTDPMKLRDAPDGLRLGWPELTQRSAQQVEEGSSAEAPTTDSTSSDDSPEVVADNLPSPKSAPDFTGLPLDPALKPGRQVFAKTCIACHSSIQPGNLEALEKEIQQAELPEDRDSLQLSPTDLRRLARRDGKLPDLYRAWAEQAVEQPEFWEQNYLSSDRRIPVTLIGTNSARAMGTNAKHGNIWEDFASLTYKELDGVGPIRFRDPFSKSTKSYVGGSGGPGYYRVPSLISAWATAPFLHNNALGDFNNDPTVEGRLQAFEDAITKLLWPRRRLDGHDRATLATGDDVNQAQARADGGLVWRTTADSYILVRGHQVPSFLAGMTGLSPFWVRWVIPWSLTAGLFGLGICLLASEWVLRWKRWIGRHFPRTRQALWPYRWLLSVIFLVGALFLIYLAFEYRGMLRLLEVSSGWVFPWLQAQSYIPALFLLAVGLLLVLDALPLRHVVTKWASVLGLVCLGAGVFVALGAGKSLAGLGGDIRIGPLPKGMPVNLVANLDPEASPVDLLVAVKALTGYLSDWHRAPASERPGLVEFEQRVAPPLMKVSKCPDLVLDRGHDYEFLQHLTDKEKLALIDLVKTF